MMIVSAPMPATCASTSSMSGRPSTRTKDLSVPMRELLPPARMATVRSGNMEWIIPRCYNLKRVRRAEGWCVMATVTLEQLVDTMTAEGELYEKHADGSLTCYACGHRCLIKPGRRGICKVRFNENGVLKVPWGYVAALQCDPTEKKPFHHVLPGSLAMTFGMLGCDYRCPGCQNWVTSQALRDPAAGVEPAAATPEQLVGLAIRQGAQLVASSYNEPLITTEWAAAIFKLAKRRGCRTCYVSNGNATPEALAYLRQWTDCYKIDLKAFTDKNYRSLGGTLER